MGVDILNIEHHNYDRDRHIITPVYLYLKEKCGLKVVSKFFGLELFYLLKYRPKVLLMSYFHGSPENNYLAKTAKKMGITVVTLTTEGNYQRENLDGYLWGWNSEKILYNDALLLWNNKSIEYALEKYPDIKEKLFLSGGTGFDRYKLLKFMTKDHFLKVHKLTKFNKVVGIAAYGIFTHIEDEKYFQLFRDTYLQSISDEQVEMHRNDVRELRNIYKELIEKHKDILFILRLHPLCKKIEFSEFLGLDSYPNVFLSDTFNHINDDEKISDLISVSDLWFAYDSGTALEAWLLNTKTLLINPSGIDFIREDTHLGSPKASSSLEVSEIIERFYARGEFPGFEEKEDERKELIMQIIGFSDGENHKRAGGIIHKFYEKSKRNTLQFYFNFPWLAFFSRFVRYYLYQSKIYNYFRTSGALKYWYPNDEKEAEKYEELYMEAFSEQLKNNANK